jgi:beta-mannosidase
MDFNGRTFLDTTFTVYLSHNSSSVYFEFPADKLVKNKDTKQLVFTGQLTSGKKILSQDNFYFEPVKDLLLGKPMIFKTIKKSPEGYLVTLTSNQLAKNIYLTCGLKGSFSENFFDLLPGERRSVTFKTTDRSGAFEGKLKIRTLADTY